MCSEYCPCTDTVQMSGWITMNDDDIALQGRPASMDWYFGSIVYDLGTGAATGTSATGKVAKKFSSFQECANYAATNKEAFSSVSDEIYNEIYYYSNTEGKNPYMSVIAFLEDYYECSGICRPNMFFATKTLDSGKPVNTCGSKVSEDVGNEIGSVGAAGVIAGLMLLCSFLSSYCLWKKYDD